jgi:hypothetical protein
MLIHIDSSAVADVMVVSDTSERSFVSIENVLAAYRDRKHIVSLRRGDLRQLRKTAALSARARAALLQIEGEQSEIDGLRKSIAWHLELGLGPSFNGEVYEERGRWVIRMSLHHFADLERVGRSVLLGENLTDAKLYALMGKAFLGLNGWRANVAYELRGGGGSQLPNEFREAASNGRIMIAIADSDQTHPKADQGAMAEQLRLEEQGKPKFQRVLVLYARCAENLLPFDVYDRALAPHAASPSIPRRLHDMEALAADLPWRAHANLKKGLRLFQLRAMPDGPEKRFWVEVSFASGRHQCAEVTSCNNAQDCRCYVVPWLGKDALEKAVDWLTTSAQTSQSLAALFNLAHDSKLTALCEQLNAWGIAPVSRENEARSPT